MVAFRIGTYRTNIAIGYIMAHLTSFDLMAHLGQGVGKAVNALCFLSEQVEHQSEGCLTPYTRQFGKFAHCFFQ